jgi:type IV secretory pathway VirB2 component (pilin)
VLQQSSRIECTFTTFGFNVLDFDFHNMSTSGPIVEVRFELLETIHGPLSLARNLAVLAVTQHV